MRLTSFSDYALRILIFAATKPDNLVTIAEISKSYGISRNHLMKVTSSLAMAGYVETLRGSGGGMRLARPASEINIGAVVRHTETGSYLVECANLKTNTCVIAPVCELRHVLFEALEAFYRHLDKKTLADLVKRPKDLLALLSKGLEAEI